MSKILRIARPVAVLAGLTAALVSGSTLSAQGLRAPLDASYIVDHHAKVARSYVEISMVRSSADGTIEIREERQGAAGDLLGQARVHAGANPAVRVPLVRRPSTDVVAVLRVGGEVLATAGLERDF